MDAMVLEPFDIEEEAQPARPKRRRPHQAYLARRLHAQAQLALIVSLLSLCFPIALPAGLFLGWRVRAHARRHMPGLVEWVSLPFYVASAGLWFGAVAGIFALFVLAIWWRN